jgi:hypothetical protein
MYDFEFMSDCFIGELGFKSRMGQRFFSCLQCSHQLWGELKTPIQWVHGALSQQAVRSSREVNNSELVLNNAEIKNAWSYSSMSPHVFTANA